MCTNTPESGPSSDLYSSSETDDPVHELGQECDPPIVANGLRPTQDPETQSMKAESNTETEMKMLRSNGQTAGLINGGIDYKVNDISGTGRKRKRIEEDITEPQTCDASSRGVDKTPFLSIGNGHRSRSPSQITLEELRCPGLATKRNRLDDSSSIYHTGNLVEELSQRGPTLVSSLSVQIWQRVFCFVPPVFLGRLLRVNRSFHSLLNPKMSPIYHDPAENTGAAMYQSAETIWAASRRRFCPGLPKPLHGLSELQMWRLLRGSDCQLCATRSSLLTPSPTSSLWESGPGATGVRIIWPFGIRCCGKCLRIHSEKEVTLLFSSTFPSFLLPALPFAFISYSEHFVPSVALRNAIPPPDVQLTKTYYKPHVEKIKRQLQNAKELGSGTADEWIKGLENDGQEKCNDTARWELWEAKGGLKKVNIRPVSKAGPSMARQTLSSALSTKTLPKFSNGNSEKVTTQGNPTAPIIGPSTTPEITSLVTLPSSAHISSTIHVNLPQRPQMLTPQVRPERNIRDVNEAKAARRAEIERRCLGLDPPLEAKVLSHMESFQAALQISTTLTENAWDVLKPRLLAQRESAELREQERIQQSKLLQARSEERKNQEAQLKEAKELLDKEWDTVQVPIRERLGVFADEVIQASWAGGSSVTKDDCPKFAADVLLYARQRFYDDVVQRDGARRAAGEIIRPDSPNNPPTRKLILENMKWLFDNKVKNFTEQFQKDLFLCNGCEGNFKFYGFEGVIQHYAAKHTTSLSMGSVVVHWRAEWPEHPPFNPDPSVAKVSYYSVPPTISSVLSQYSRQPQTTASYGEYGQAVTPPVQSPYRIHYPMQPQNGHYQQLAPVQNTYPQTSGYDGPPAIPQPGVHYHTSRPEIPAMLPHGYQSYSENSANHLQLYHSGKSGNSYRPAAQHLVYTEGYSPRYPGGLYPASLSTVPPVNPVPPHLPHNAPSYQTMHMPGVDLYQAQMNEMAHQSRSVWVGTSGIKDIPQSVRIFIVMHHMIIRFKHKYTIEPSLSMFIDGLNHNPLMRPVRNLNGLACKACVTLGSGSGVDYHTHPRLMATDRKLYTLPHLLNHFKSVHVEKIQSVVNPHNCLESPRLDWKHDMIELPDIPLIANLVNAPGMDNLKLQLLAAVFPAIFPNHLPTRGSVRHAEKIPVYDMEHGGAIARQYDRSSDQEMAQTCLIQPDIQSHSDGPTPLRPESLLQPPSRSSTRASEPPGDDEYDPNRPAYYGKIVDSRQFPLRNATHDSGSTDVVQVQKNAIIPQESTYDETYPNTFLSQASDEIKPRGDHDQAERTRGHEDLHFNSARSEFTGHKRDPSIAATKVGNTNDLSIGDSSRYVSEDGELVEEPLSVHQNHNSASHAADVTAAERFLNDFNPGISQNGEQFDSDTRNRGLRGYPSKQKTVEATADQRSVSVGRAAGVIPLRRSDINADHSLHSTPSIAERADSCNGGNLQYTHFPNDHRQFHDAQSQPISNARHRYTEDIYPTSVFSPRVYDACANSYAAHSAFGTDERIVSVPRSARNPSQWSHTGSRRSRSRSPIQMTRNFEQYRVKSPRQRSPRAAIYHVSSPALPSDSRTKRIMEYAYPTDQTDLTRTRTAGYPEENYGHRIEYIPIRADDHGYQERGRYTIAQPIEQLRSTDPMRIERSYIGEEVFERDGQFYYTARRQADARPVRAANPAYIEYRSDLR